MEWTIPKYSPSAVDKAGKVLSKTAKPWAEDWESENRVEVVNNWRWAHNFPLNTFKIGLRHKTRAIDNTSVSVQRLKRLPSILNKLSSASTRLSQMQDIAGCRAVMRSVRAVYRLFVAYRESSLKHKLDAVDDYIADPRSSGYRGVHLIYEYRSDRASHFNGLFVELQLRSRLQHAWATAVETVDAFTHQDLKRGNGKPEWARFFCLMGNYLAIHENTRTASDVPSSVKELQKEIKHYQEKLKVEEHLRAFGTAVIHLPKAKHAPGYFLLELDIVAQSINVTYYPLKYAEQANNDLLEIERRIADKREHDAVLVSAESVSEIRRGFPNYFGDSRTFIAAIGHAVRKS